MVENKIEKSLFANVRTGVVLIKFLCHLSCQASSLSSFEDSPGAPKGNFSPCSSLVKYTEWRTKSKEKLNNEALEKKIPKKALESQDQEPLDWLLMVLALL